MYGTVYAQSRWKIKCVCVCFEQGVGNLSLWAWASAEGTLYRFKLEQMLHVHHSLAVAGWQQRIVLAVDD